MPNELRIPTREQLAELQSKTADPALSIICPTFRRHPDNEGDPIRMKNLVAESEKRMLQDYDKRLVARIMERVNEIVEGIDWRYTQDTIVILASEDWATRFDLPFAMPERVQVDKTFATRDLVFAINRTPSYYFLVLSEKNTRLLFGSKNGLTEVEDDVFPLAYEMTTDTQLPTKGAAEFSSQRERLLRNYLTKVTDAVHERISENEGKLVVSGAEEILSFFMDIDKNRNTVVGTVAGSYPLASSHELADKGWPVVQDSIYREREEILERFGNAIGAGRFATGIRNVWEQAINGNGDTIIVEENYHEPARISSDPIAFELVENSDNNVEDDAVDEVIEQVMQKGGKAFFVDDGKLSDHQRIALITRY